jgi:hypothetical protein
MLSFFFLVEPSKKHDARKFQALADFRELSLCQVAFRDASEENRRRNFR